MRIEELLPLTPLSFHILLALSKGPSHGYAVGKAIEELSLGRLCPTTGSLYQAIKRLRESGLLEEANAPVNDRSGGPPRLYFSVTDAGRQVLRLEAARLRNLLDFALEADVLPTPVSSR